MKATRQPPSSLTTIRSSIMAIGMAGAHDPHAGHGSGNTHWIEAEHGNDLSAPLQAPVR